MAVTRRQFLTATGTAAGAHILLPAAVRAGAAFGATGPASDSRTRNRVVVIFLAGGNDGLNTVVPTGDVRGAARYSVYKKVRPAVAYTPSQTLPLNHPGDASEKLGLNSRLKTMHRLYRDNRLAIVQGVDYPNHNYSHFESSDIWQSGEPDRVPESGWVGRHLDRAGIGEGELRGLGIGYTVPLMLRGRASTGVQITSVAATRFGDGFGEVADPRHTALSAFSHFPGSEPLRAYVGRDARSTASMVERLRKTKLPKETSNPFINVLLTVRTLFEQDLGVECVYVQQDGYDTHTNQRVDHERRLGDLDTAIEAFFYGTVAGQPTGTGPLPAALASRTLLMVVSEFGRRIGENGAGSLAGTDHGAAAPVFIAGPAGAGGTGRRLVPGLHGDHPKMGTTKMPVDNLEMTTDVRRVFQSVLQDWLHDPDPMFGQPLTGLFR